MKRFFYVLAIFAPFNVAVAEEPQLMPLQLPACKYFWDWESTYKIIQAHDTKALTAFLTPRYQNGECTVLMKGEAVFIHEVMDRDEGKLICLRRQGEPDCWWTAYVLRRQ